MFRTNAAGFRRLAAARAAVAALLIVAPPAIAQQVMVSTTGAAGPPRTTAIRRIATPNITVDGNLNEPAWKEAALVTGFTQREPQQGAPSNERTEVRIFSDGEALYVGAWMFDSHAESIVPGEKVRDADLTASDYFAFILDTFHDRQNGFVFATTPAGIEYDGQVTREGEGGGVTQTGQTRAQTGAIGGFNLNWDGSWTVATSRDALGWYAEFRIPFTTLRYGAGTSQVWGINVARLVRRTNEESFWAPIPRALSLYRVSLAGTLTDVAPPAQRIATVTPYVIASTRTDMVPAHATTNKQDAGIDAKYGLTQSLTLDLTYNTDFAQVEVDDQRVNLTRFPLFFPEKRPFFLEGAGIFTAGTPQAVDLFFSRRIGIDTLGNPLPILGGGRLTGRVGGVTIGALQMFTRPSAGQLGQSYSVGRATAEIGRRSRIGVIGIERLSPDSSADYHRTFGIDGRYGAGNEWTLDWWGAMTQSPRRGNDNFGFSGRLAYLTDEWNNSVRVLDVGTDFVPELGFLNRTPGYHHTEIQVMKFVRFASAPWLRVWNPHVTYRGWYGTDGFHQSGQWHFDLTEIETSSGGRFGPEFNIYHEGLKAPFAIAPKVTLPVGSYDYPELGFDWTTNPSLPLSMVLRGDWGPFYNGRRNSLTITTTARRGATLSSSLLVDYSDVHLAQGNFIRSIVGMRVAYFFTPRVSIQTLTQYNNQVRAWTANTRFSWLNTAGTGLFIVFNDAEEADSYLEWKRPQMRAFTVKFSRQFGSRG